MRKLIIALIGLAILGAVLYFSGFTEAFMYGFEGHAGLPSCDSSHGQSDAKAALENAPFAKTLHINIIAITEAKMTSGNTEKVECQAAVILNNSKKGKMNYTFTHDPTLPSGQYFVQSSLDLESFQPYP